MDLRVIVIIVCIQCALALFIPSAQRDFRKKTPARTDHSDLLRDLAVIKLKLETMGYGPVYIEGPFDNAPMAKSIQDTDTIALPPTIVEDSALHFNEIEVLQLIPVIIEQSRKGNISPDEEATLKDIFGDLWIVIEEEVNRPDGEEMNPILKALLQSNDNRLKRALVQNQQHNDEETGMEVEEKNDVFGNSVDLVRVTRWPKSFVELNAVELSPQQRLMRRAAFVIRQWFDENGSKSRSVRGRVGLKQKKVNKEKRRSGRRTANRRKNKNGRSGRRKKKQNLRPKRHNTEIYVDDNHGYHDYNDFDDESYDDLMTKPRSMRSSPARHLFNEYDSMEDEDDQEYEDQNVSST